MKYNKGDKFVVVTHSGAAAKYGECLTLDSVDEFGILLCKNKEGKTIFALPGEVRPKVAIEVFVHGNHVAAVLPNHVTISSIGKDAETKVAAAVAKVVC